MATLAAGEALTGDETQVSAEGLHEARSGRLRLRLATGLLETDALATRAGGTQRADRGQPRRDWRCSVAGRLDSRRVAGRGAARSELSLVTPAAALATVLERLVRCRHH